MIREEIIDKIGAQLEEMDFDSEFDRFTKEYPVLHAYLGNEQFQALSDDEFMTLWFATIVIIKSYEEAGFKEIQIDPKLLEEHESDNWSVFENSKPGGFNKKLDVFFDRTNQEDLLAFIEDLLTDDEEEETTLTSAAKEILFISLCAITEVLDDLLNK